MEWDEASRFPSELIPKLAELGLLGVIFPEAIRRRGAGLSRICDRHRGIVARRRLGGTDSWRRTIRFAPTTSTNSAARRSGRNTWCRWRAAKNWVAGRLPSRNRAPMPAERAPRARFDGDGWVINGAKTFTTNGHYADVCVAMAVTDPGKSTHGISAFIVEKGTPGFPSRARRKTSSACARAIPRRSFSAIAASRRKTCWESRGKGFVNTLQVLDGGRISIAALGAGNGAGRVRRRHEIRQRAQAVWPGHRRVPGHSVQAGRHGHGNCGGAPARLSCGVARGPFPPREHDGADGARRFTLESSMAKLYASEVAVRVASEAVQIFGGYGFIKDYPAEKYYRDVKLCTIGEGTSEIQRLVIARQILGKPAASE